MLDGCFWLVNRIIYFPVTRRARQRDATRERIVEAALGAFADNGFRGASTRDIARRARANQGLITYHFRSKEELWRAAADRIFAMLVHRLGESLASVDTSDPRDRARAAIRAYVRFAAAHPELFRLMVEEGKSGDARMQWLVDTHLAPIYERFVELGGSFGEGREASLLPHLYYVLAGAASLIFAVAPECRRLTGRDPERAQAVEAHARLVERLLVP
jgi:TetR/AcrR family transcriptional regulator